MTSAVLLGAAGAAVAETGIADTVISGPFLLAGLLALAAGVVSFASPCVVPLVPGYLSYLAGLVGAEIGPRQDAPPRRARSRIVAATALFVGGFSLVFIAESALVLGIYTTLIANQETLMRISGGVAIVMGLVLAGAVPLLQRDRRPVLRARGRLWGAPVLGAAFGTGWLACTSPTLVGIIALSSATEWNGNALRGLILVVLYCAGLGIPFLLMALGFGWAGGAWQFLRRHARGIQYGGAAVLVTLGVLMLAGVWDRVLAPLQGTVLLL